jgi:hypothetical protein
MNLEIVALYNDYLKLTENPQAAATLVVAHVTLNKHAHNPADAMNVRQVAQRSGVRTTGARFSSRR